MALDDALLDSASEPGYTTTLRIYSWQPICLSLGQMQPVSDVDKDRLERNGWDLVRRPTGGRAILHTNEITYSITGRTDDPLFGGGILPSYRRISLSLQAFLAYYGLTPESKDSANTTAGPTQAVCFEVPSQYEITLKGKKIIGSAQARNSNSVLQHGTIPLSGDITRITQVLFYPEESMREEAARRITERATTLQAELKTLIYYPVAVQDFIRAFEFTQNISLLPGELTKFEAELANELMDSKYTLGGWTNRA
jgi:lipoate-protein ligase A